jgi:Domain of unknown function (DUF4340)
VNLVRKTIFWALVLIALGGTAHFFEQKVDETRQAKEASLRLLPFPIDEVTEFWVSNNRQNTRIRVLRTPDGWRLVSPLSAKADDEAIDKMLLNVVLGRKDAVLFSQPEPEKLRELGLDAPVFEVGFKLADSETTILFGDSGPTHNVAYAMLKGDPRVYRIHASVREEANKDVYAFRDKTVLDIDPVKMRRFELQSAGADRVVIEHDKGKWLMLEPTAGMAAMGKVLESLYDIKNAQIKGFVDEMPSDLVVYGLSAPRLVFKIYEEGLETPQVLSIGSKDRVRRGYFAMTNRAENVFVVEEGLVNAILTNRDKWSEAGIAANP